MLLSIRYKFYRVILLFSAVFLLSCEQDLPSESAPVLTELVSPNSQLSNKSRDIFAQTDALWQAGREALAIALQEVERLHDSMQIFLGDPSQTNLDLAREQWLKASAAFTAIQPLLSTNISSTAKQRLVYIAHWPFYPGYIDSFGSYRNSGIVNAIDTPLDLSLVRTYHQQYESNELLLGFYPMAYVLWSEYDPRPAADFLPIKSSSTALKKEAVKVLQLPQNRRRQLLRLQSEWLLLDSKALNDSWVEGELYEAFQQLLPDERMRMMTDSLLQSLNGLLLSSDAEVGLPSRFKEQSRENAREMVSNIGRYYFDYHLAHYWLNEEQQLLAKKLFSQVQQPETWASEDDYITTIRALMTVLSPDVPQAINVTSQ